MSKCSAVSTIIRRTIASPTESNDEAVLNLAGAILRGVGADPNQVGPVTTALGDAIASARVVAFSAAAGASVSSHCPDAVADRVTADLSCAVDKIRNAALFASRAGREDFIRTLEADIDALATSLASTSTNGGLLGLMKKRDCHRTTAEKSSAVVAITVAAAAALDEKDASAPNDVPSAIFTEDEPDGVVAAVLGDEYDAILSAKADYDSLRSVLDAARSASASGRADLISERDTYKAEREKVNIQIEELRRQMEDLEKKGSDLDAQAGAIEGRLEELDAALEDEIKDVKTDLIKRSGAVKLEEAARGVADGFSSFRAALNEATSAPIDTEVTSPEEDTLSPEKICNKMSVYFVRLRNYFKAEADCIEFISTRAANLERDLPDLEREIDECRALGMTTNVTHITQSLKEAKHNIVEDKNAVKTLRKEAENMQVDFMGRLKEYSAVSSGTQTNQALTSLQLSVLGGIRDAMHRIGLEDNGLEEYSADVKDMSQIEYGSSENNEDDDTDTGNDELENDNDSSLDLDHAPCAEVKEVAMTDMSIASTVTNCDNLANWTAPPVSASKMTKLSWGAPQTETTPTLTAPLAITATRTPKLSWATAGASAAGAPKAKSKSLLEIQQEELAAKESAKQSS